MDNLFELIKALSKNEKRYFKLFYSTYSKKEENNYIKLFNALDKLKNYDEDKLAKILNDRKLTNRLAGEKSFLYRQILGSLRNYHSEKSVDGLLKNFLLEANVLFNKALFIQCEKILNRAEKLALEHEKYEALLEITQLYNNVYYRKVSSANREWTIETIYHKQNKALTELTNLISFKRLQDLYFEITKQTQHFTRSRKNKNEVQKIINHPLLSNKKNALSDSAKRIYFILHAKYQLSQRAYKNASIYFKEQVLLMESNPEKIKANPNAYISDRYNYLTALLLFEKDLLIVTKALADFRSLLKIYTRNNISLKIKKLISYDSYFIELVYYCQHGLFEEAKPILPVIEKLVENGEENSGTNDLISFQFCLGVLYFGLKKHEICLSYLNKILSYPTNDERQDITCAARIVILIVHFEKGNTDLLHYLTRSTYRYLINRGSLHLIEKKIIDFIRSGIEKTFNKQDIIQELCILKKELLSVFKKNPAEETFLKYFDIISWLESRIENKSFAELVRIKAIS